MKTLLLLYGDSSIEVPFSREQVKAYWRHALDSGERFINFGPLWVRTDSIYAIEAHE